MNHLYLDIETIPAQSDQAKAIIAATVKPPAQMTKADTIAAWVAEKKEAAVMEAIAKTSFDGGLGHVCCIGFALNDGQIYSQTAFNVGEEKQIIEAAFEMISVMAHENWSPIQVVGHYVAGFDLRFLTQRAIVLGIRLPTWWPKDPKPWSAEVFDTMTVWAGVKGTVSLDSLCLALGLEGKGDIDGSMIAKMFAEGHHAEIAEYCKDDVKRVRNVHRKMQIAMGEAA